ncbi:MAG: metallophosphoesterase [Tannerellaceae bacterium]
MKSNFYKSLILFAILTLAGTSCTPVQGRETSATQNEAATQTITFDKPAVSEDAFNFYVANDLGRNGYYLQKPIAELMGEMAAEVDVEFVAAVGDTHHFLGVSSVDDPLWMTNYEQIYAHPELMIDWFAVCGNHEYRGNTQAVIDYTNVSRRWNMEDRYYSKVVDAGKNEKALLVFIDTAPLIDKYRKSSEEYPDAVKQDMNKQLTWIDSTLKNSDTKWKIVLGHHPVYAETKKSKSERTDLQERLQPILDKNGVDMYLCGHIHNFQHIRMPDSNVDYVVNSSGSLARKVKETEGTLFCSSDAGYSLVSMNDNTVDLFMINGNGKIIYTIHKEK